jgi:hypothetical protein
VIASFSSRFSISPAWAAGGFSTSYPFSFEVLRAKVLETGGFQRASRPADRERKPVSADTASIPATSDVSSHSFLISAFYTAAIRDHCLKREGFYTLCFFCERTLLMWREEA